MTGRLHIARETFVLRTPEHVGIVGDHTTVLHAVRKIEALVGKDTTLQDEVESLKRQLAE